ncbi:hypothetical protein D5086_001093 [Populus alba]|uniref:Uncharacterized protein n=1 Tax=Populus alba TaxID=43335 RepID=A0ACC4CXR1_POPAL
MMPLLQAIVSFTATKIKMREVGWLESCEVEVEVEAGVVVLVLAFVWFSCGSVGFTTVVEERKGLLGYEEASMVEKPAMVVDGGGGFEVTGLLRDGATSTTSKLMGMEAPPRGEWLKNKKILEREQRRDWRWFQISLAAPINASDKFHFSKRRLEIQATSQGARRHVPSTSKEISWKRQRGGVDSGEPIGTCQSVN